MIDEKIIPLGIETDPVSIIFPHLHATAVCVTMLNIEGTPRPDNTRAIPMTCRYNRRKIEDSLQAKHGASEYSSPDTEAQLPHPDLPEAQGKQRGVEPGGRTRI